MRCPYISGHGFEKISSVAICVSDYADHLGGFDGLMVGETLPCLSGRMWMLSLDPILLRQGPLDLCEGNRHASIQTMMR